MAWEDLPEEIREKIETSFRRSYSALGTIESPTKNGLIFLAKKGAEIWNAWSDSNQEFYADFSSTTFNDEIDFTGFIFPQSENGKTSFNKCRFIGPAKFANCTFSPTCEMEEISFENVADFKFCVFIGKVSFRKCKFNEAAEFEKTHFYDDAIFAEISTSSSIKFKGSKFGGQSNFCSAAIRQSADFSRCEFQGKAAFNNSKLWAEIEFRESNFFSEAEFIHISDANNISFTNTKFEKKIVFTRNIVGQSNFSGAQFKNEAIFSMSAFKGEHYFNKCIFFAHTSFRGCEFSDHVEFDLAEFKKTLNFSCLLTESEPKEAREIKNISFSGCKFLGTANFNNRIFSSKLNYAKKVIQKKEYFTEFVKAPTFHGCKFHQDTSFHGAIFYQDHGDEAARAYRTLKLAFEQLKSTREEQRFFKHEMQAERPELTGWKWLFSSTYGLFSDYGFSILRPLVTLILVSIAIGAAHGTIANMIAGANWKEAITPQAKNLETPETFAAIQYVLINAIPAPGTDKTQQKFREDLFKTEKQPSLLSTTALALEFLHKFIALLCVFLSGLAVRNLLKMKS